MRLNIRFLLLTCALAALFHQNSFSDDNQPAPPPMPEQKSPLDRAFGSTTAVTSDIALIDMAKLFKSCHRFSKLREELKKDIGIVDTEAKAMSVDLAALDQRLKNIKQGTEEYDATAALMSVKRAKFEAYRKQQERHFLREEAAIYKQVYLELQNQIRIYSAAHGIRLVIRFDSTPINDDDPKKILQKMNRQVVYQEGLDITNAIIALVNTQIN